MNQKIEMDKPLIHIYSNKPNLESLVLGFESIDNEIEIIIKLDDLNYDKSKNRLIFLFENMLKLIKENLHE